MLLGRGLGVSGTAQTSANRAILRRQPGPQIAIRPAGTSVEWVLDLARALAAQAGKSITWSVLGGNGMTVKRVLASIRAKHQERYDVAVVLLGVNDVFRLTPVKAWLLNLRLLAKSLAEQGCQVIVLSAVPPVGRFPALPQPLTAILGVRAALLDHHLARLAGRLSGVVHCNVRFPTDQACVATDGVHPSAAGYRDWAEQLVVAVSAELAEGRPRGGAKLA